MEVFLRILPVSQPIIVRYGVTLVVVLLSFGLRIGIDERAGTYGFIIFLPAIVAAALLFDRGTGFFALLLSIILVSTVIPWGSEPEVHVSALAGFAMVGSGLVLVAESLHKALERATRAEREKDLLLREMSHRVRNKFAMILSIIGLQARDAPPEARSALDAVASRVRVIAKVHDHLQLAGQGQIVDMREYLGGLCRSLGDALGHLRPVIISVTADEVTLPPDKALSIGLIVNELVTNAFKYAFPENKAGKIVVQFRQDAEEVILSVADNGVGCPEQVQAGLGANLVATFASQLEGSVSRENAGPGCHIVVRLPFSQLMH